MRRGIGRLRAGGGGSNPAAAWAAAVTANGGTYSAGTLTAVTNFVASAKASGYWDKLNRINLFCGDQLAAALVPLKAGGGNATETNNNFVSGDYTEATGLTGNGSTKFLQTGLIPSVSLSPNDTHLAIYNRSASAVGGGYHIGAETGAEVRFEGALPFTDGSWYSIQYGSSGAVIVASSTPYGLLVGSRTSSSVHTMYRGGASVGSSATISGTLPAVEAYVFAKNVSAVATNLTSHVLAAYSIGSGLSGADATAYNTHMQTFQTALSRNV